MVTRRWVIAGLMAGGAAPVLADAPLTSPRPPARPGAPGAPLVRKTMSGKAAVAAAQLGGPVGYLAVDTRTGEVVDALDPDVPLPPASTAKVITTLYAW